MYGCDHTCMVMYGCVMYWTIKKAEHQRIGAFEQWCWRRLLRVPWNTRRSNQSILKEISPGCSLEGLMLKLKPQYFGHMMRRADSLEKTLMLERLREGGEGEDRGWDGWVASLIQWIWGLSKLRETAKDREAWCCKELYCIGTWNVRSMNQGKLDMGTQEMARLNLNILGINELKWMGMGEFNSLLLWERIP